MASVTQPEFNPKYEPLVMPDGEVKQDSILVHCYDDTHNEFVYNAWDGQARWFVLDNSETGENYFTGGMNVGDAVVVPNVPGVTVHYYSGDIYDYKVVPGQCQIETPSTTVPETTTTSTAPTSTTTMDNEPTTTTSSPEMSTTSTTVENSTTTSEPSTSLVSLVTLPTPGECYWDENVQRYRNSVNQQFMSSAECNGEETVATVAAIPPTPARSSNLAATGPGVDPMLLVFLAILLLAVGSIVFKPVVSYLKTRHN